MSNKHEVNEFQLGQLVHSRTGRDKGSYYLVVGFVPHRVLVANGTTRTVAQPKKKNPQHLVKHRPVAAEIALLLERCRQECSVAINVQIQTVLCNLVGEKENKC